MCESVEIRYVHYMEHKDYPDTLGVGCICAEHIENDYVAPHERERRLRSKSRRRSTWAKRQWSLSAKGNPYLNTEGFNLTIFPVSDRKGLGWSVRVTNRGTGANQLGRGRYSSIADAKNRALDALIWAKDNLRKPPQL